MAYSMYSVNETYIVSAQIAISTKRVHLTSKNKSRLSTHVEL